MPIKNNSCYFIYLMLILVFVLQSAFYPNFILAEEHHYLEVAANFFYHPHGVMLEDTMGAYFSKPPLLFWMLSGLWTLFGVHTWVIHFLLISILAGILCSSQHLYRLLFNNVKQARLVPMIILGSFCFLSRSTVFCFDSLVVLLFVLSAIGITLALKHHYIRGFILYGLAVGLGILSKGPIILGFCLPFFIIATFLRADYQVRDRAWFGGFLLSIAIIFGLLATWLLPLLPSLGPARRQMLLFHRGLGVGNTYGRAPFYFYLKACAYLFLPWLLWPYGVRALWFSIRRNHNSAFKLVLYSLILSLVILSIIPPKALRYGMSSLVLFALLYTYALVQNEFKFNFLRHSTRTLLMFFVSVAVLLEVMTLYRPEWIMSKITYPAITYWWIICFESLLVFVGGILIYLQKSDISFEVGRVCGFTFVLVISLYVLPHELMSQDYAYSSLVTYLDDLKQRNMPIVYCRAYGGYQYSLTRPMLPEMKYKLTRKEAQLYDFVYFVEEVKKKWPAQQDYLYRLVDPSQTSAIFIRKVPAMGVAALSFKQQRC